MTKTIVFYAAYMALLIFSSNSYAQAQVETVCGEIPEDPAVVDGQVANLDELIANSKEVKQFIKDSDIFLDCMESMNSRMSGRINNEKKKQMGISFTMATRKRNEIGDQFNEQVAAYKKANPDAK